MDGRNHYPDDIEATIQEITGGRVAAISVPDDRSEQLVAIVGAQEARQLRRGGREQISHRETGSGVGDFEVARPAGGRSRHGAAGFDPDHHERKDPTLGVRRDLPSGGIQPPGHHRMTCFGEAVLPHCWSTTRSPAWDAARQRGSRGSAATERDCMTAAFDAAASDRPAAPAVWKRSTDMRASAMTSCFDGFRKGWVER